MRKMLFSAMALVAFTATSMAGEKPKEDVKTVIKTDCKQVANALIGLHETDGIWDYVVTWVIIYNNCVESTKHLN